MVDVKTDELKENWTSTDLNVYINRIQEGERDKVLALILDKKRLRQYLATPDGALLLRDAINIIRTELGEIYTFAMKDPRANIDKIVASSDRCRAAMDIMYRWMDLLKKGEHHEKQVVEISKRDK